MAAAEPVRLRAGAGQHRCLVLWVVTALALQACGSEREQVMQAYRPVSIESAIWTQAAAIQWPSRERSVLFIHHEGELSEDVCSLSVRQRISGFFEETSTKGLRIGEACGRLFVLFKDRSLDRWPLALEFAAHHEAFHLAAQIYGSKVPIEFLAVRRQDVGPNANRFFQQVEGSVGERSEAIELAELCGILRNEYLTLPESERDRIDAVAYWEWPAEYYAYQAMASRHDSFPSRYRSIRSRIGSLAEYSPGVATGMLLDRELGRSHWQLRVAGGETMIQIAASLCGIRTIPVNRAAGRISRYHLFVN